MYIMVYIDDIIGNKLLNIFYILLHKKNYILKSKNNFHFKNDFFFLK